jgi:hypothetical protein
VTSPPGVHAVQSRRAPGARLSRRLGAVDVAQDVGGVDERMDVEGAGSPDQRRRDPAASPHTEPSQTGHRRQLPVIRVEAPACGEGFL